MASVAPGAVNSRIRSSPFRANQIRSQQKDFAKLDLRELGVQRLQSFAFFLGPILVLQARRDAQRRKNAKPKRALEATQCCAGRVAVIGAGPAGLAAALALRRDGLDVNIYERSPELRPGIGGGVQLHSGAALLQELGVDLGFAQPMRRIRSRAVDGSELLKLDLPSLMDRFKVFVGSVRQPSGDPASCTVMRDALLRAIADQLPPDSLFLGKELEDVKQTSDGKVICRFGDSEEDFDLVIGADGIGSLVRGMVLQEVDKKPRYTGLRIQYGVREAGARPTGCEEEVHQWFGEGVYALTATYGGLDGKQFEMLAVVFRDDSPVAENANWNPAEVKDSCLERLQAAGHVEEVLELAKGCKRYFELGVCERPLGLNRWHRGRIVLVGDSAHAMPPFLGQGANQGIQDAVCLASQLRKIGLASLDTSDSAKMNSAIESALAAYTAKRLPPVALLGLESGFLGQVETLPGPAGALVRDNFFRLTGGSGVAGLVFLNGALARV